MIEDALKSARNLHRLIIAVSLITLVFSLSLNLPTDTIRLKAAIDRLIETDFRAYETFLRRKIDAYAEQNLSPIADSVNKDLEALGLRVFQLRHIGEALGKPLHVGKLLMEELVLNDLSAASLNKLDALNVLDLDRDVQVLKPRTEELMEVLESFLKENVYSTKRVESVRAEILGSPSTAQSFLPGDTAMAGLYFELLENFVAGGAPVFNATFIADIETLPGTAFLNWIESDLKGNDAVAVDNGAITFLPKLTDIPKGYREENLGTLSLRLADEIKSKGPENLSATILGTEVPGLLIVLASPTILLFLSYYFMQHTAHLRDLVTDDVTAFRQFAWLPLALRATGGTGADPPVSQAWGLETLATAIILPVLALIVLYVQLSQHGGLEPHHKLLMGFAGLAIMLMGRRSLRHIGEIRGQLTQAVVSKSAEK